MPIHYKKSLSIAMVLTAVSCNAYANVGTSVALNPDVAVTRFANGCGFGNKNLIVESRNGEDGLRFVVAISPEKQQAALTNIVVQFGKENVSFPPHPGMRQGEFTGQIGPDQVMPFYMRPSCGWYAKQRLA